MEQQQALLLLLHRAFPHELVPLRNQVHGGRDIRELIIELGGDVIVVRLWRELSGGCALVFAKREAAAEQFLLVALWIHPQRRIRIHRECPLAKQEVPFIRAVEINKLHHALVLLV